MWKVSTKIWGVTWTNFHKPIFQLFSNTPVIIPNKETHYRISMYRMEHEGSGDYAQFIWKDDSAKKMNMKYHLSWVIRYLSIYPLPIFYILENLGTRLFEGQTISPRLTHLFPPQYKNSDLPRNHEPESREMVTGGWLFMFHFFTQSSI